ncbi:MAG: hypothetical protein Hals2KO_17020 [Halioglobus sp.]
MTGSALQSLELIERLHAEVGVEAPRPAEHSLRWIGTWIGIAGVPLLVGEGEIEEIVETPPVTRIPGTKPWVMGVAAFKGGLLPVISGDALFRREPYSGRVRDYCMVIKRPGLYFGITLSHVEGNFGLPIQDRLTDHSVDPDFEKYTVGGFSYRGEFLAILDIDKLVADEAVSDASAANGFSSEGKDDEH